MSKYRILAIYATRKALDDDVRSLEWKAEILELKVTKLREEARYIREHADELCSADEPSVTRG